MSKLPNEILSKIFTSVSSPLADIMNPYIQSYSQYASWFSDRFETVTLAEYMFVNAIYLDYTSKRHIRAQTRILKMFFSLSYTFSISCRRYCLSSPFNL